MHQSRRAAAVPASRCGGGRHRRRHGGAVVRALRAAVQARRRGLLRRRAARGRPSLIGRWRRARWRGYRRGAFVHPRQLVTLTHAHINHEWKPTQPPSLSEMNKKLSYRLGTARCVVSVVILPIATQQCRNYLYDKS